LAAFLKLCVDWLVKRTPTQGCQILLQASSEGGFISVEKIPANEPGMNAPSTTGEPAAETAFQTLK